MQWNSVLNLEKCHRNVWNASDCFGASCMNRASFFVWNKRFKEGRESVRDDERCRTSKEVRTPKLIGQIKNFMDKDRCTSIETIIAVWELYTQLFARNWRCGRFARSLSQECSERSERKTLSWQKGDGRADQFRFRSSCCFGDLRWKLDLLLWPRDQETESPAAVYWLSQTREGHTEQIHSQTFDDPFFWQHCHDLHALGSHWTDSQQGILCWGFKVVQKEIPSEEASTFQIGSVAFPPGQCTSPQLHPCHRLFDQDGHQDSSHSPNSQDLAPCDFCLFPKFKENLRGCRYETIGEMKETVTKVIDTLTQEDFHGTFQKLLESYNKCIAAGGDYVEGD